MLYSTFILSLFSAAASAALSESNLETHVGALTLSAKFNPVKEAYWTGYPKHRRTPFSVSPDRKSAYLAYLDSSDVNVHVQQVDPSTFSAVGEKVTITGAKEAGGLVAHNDGFALLTNEPVPSGTANAPPGSTPVAVLYRYTSGKQTWKTWLGGPTVEGSSGHTSSPDLNGDLVYSETAKKYGAYFVVTAYDGSASGHFGDTVQYVSDSGTLEKIAGATSDGFGCSHNTGLALEAADAPPYASVCAEDQGNIWLNTETQSMRGVKVSNENVTNGASNEALGGTSGSYSSLARMVDSNEYILTWVSKGAKDLSTNDWLGKPYTHSVNRTANRNVAIARFSDKKTLVGEQATSTLGGSGDDQVNWITTGTADRSNAHVAAFDSTNALVTYEEIASPNCPLIAFGCEGAFSGSFFQLVNKGEKVGEPVKKTDVYVAGDIVTMGTGKVCWPYVDMAWDLKASAGRSNAAVSAISFACMSLDGSASSGNSSSPAPASPSSAAAPASSSTGVKDVSVSPSAAATPSQAPTSAVAPAPQASSSGLPSFVIASSGATTTPAASSPPAASPTIILEPTSGSGETTVASSAPSAKPTKTSVPTSAPQEEQPKPSAAPSASTTCTGSDSESTDLPETPEVPESPEVPEVPSNSALPAFPSGSGTPPFPFPPTFPSGFPFPTGHKGHKGGKTHKGHPGSGARPSGYGVFPQAFGFDDRPRPTGGFKHGWGHGRPTGGFNWGRPCPTGGFGGARPTGGFGFGGPRPSGSAAGVLGGVAAAQSTPCTLQTRVRPTASGAAQ